MRFWNKGKRLLGQVREAEVGVYAANASFFILLSIFPGMMLLLGILQYTSLTSEELLRGLNGFLPGELSPLLDYMIRELFARRDGTLLSLSAVTALWSASRGVYSLLRGMNRVYQVRETRSWLLLRLRCALYTVLLLVALVASLSLQLLGERTVEYLKQRNAMFPLRCLEHRYWIVLPFLCLLFSLLYLAFPNKRQRLVRVLPGAIFSALGWVLFSGLFSLYVERYGNYAATYGSLTVIALTMLWLYACLCILFFGGLLNQLLPPPTEKAA